MEKKVSNNNAIEMYLHCNKCLSEINDTGMKITPKDYAKISIGFTDVGIQLWCDRHDCNVAHIDFEGHQHPANTSAEKEKD